MAKTDSDLASGRCKPCEGGVAPLKEQEIRNLLKQLDGWTHANGRIVKTYDFKDYYQTMAFVNAAAWISHREDRHVRVMVLAVPRRVHDPRHQRSLRE